MRACFCLPPAARWSQALASVCFPRSNAPDSSRSRRSKTRTGAPDRSENAPMISRAAVVPGTFSALVFRDLGGVQIVQRDVDLVRKVIVVKESFVRKFWPDQEPLGKHIDQDEVVGMVEDVRFSRFNAPPE